MYTSFFGLNEKPFAITPDPRYLFMSERHGEALAHLVYGVTESGGFMQLTGEVGTGKTTLVRTLLQNKLPKNADVAVVLNPRLSGRRVILVVDEAQNLSRDVLEQVRLLTNLETAKQKLLQIILIGQPELRDLLAREDLRQLAQRITGRYHLEPLSRDETAQYIEHRLRVAGALGEVFDNAAKREVFRLTDGVPRLINVICDRALLGAYSKETRRVNRRLVRRAAAEIKGIPYTTPLLRLAVPVVGGIAVAVIAATLWPLLGERSDPVSTVPARSVAAMENEPASAVAASGSRSDAGCAAAALRRIDQARARIRGSLRNLGPRVQRTGHERLRNCRERGLRVPDAARFVEQSAAAGPASYPDAYGQPRQVAPCRA
jgi:general secretion pathway protein A